VLWIDPARSTIFSRKEPSEKPGAIQSGSDGLQGTAEARHHNHDLGMAREGSAGAGVQRGLPDRAI